MQHSGTVLAGASAAASVTIGPFAEVFNEAGLLMFVMGLLGGLTGHLGIKLQIKTAWRPAIVGGLIGFGLGVVAPPLLKAFLEVDLLADTTARGLAAVTYIVGMMHERILAYVGGKAQ